MVTFFLNPAGTDWVDPDDPTVIAENELLGAANSIDAAAKKLASLRPRRSVQVRRTIQSYMLLKARGETCGLPRDMFDILGCLS